MRTFKKIAQSASLGQYKRNCLKKPWSLEYNIQRSQFYTCGPINRKLVFLIPEIKDFIVQMIVLFECQPSMKAFLKIVELNYLRHWSPLPPPLLTFHHFPPHMPLPLITPLNLNLCSKKRFLHFPLLYSRSITPFPSKVS